MKESENKMLEQVSNAQRLYNESEKKLEHARKVIMKHIQIATRRKKKTKHRKLQDSKKTSGSEKLISGVYQEWKKKHGSKNSVPKAYLGRHNKSVLEHQTVKKSNSDAITTKGFIKNNSYKHDSSISDDGSKQKSEDNTSSDRKKDKRPDNTGEENDSKDKTSKSQAVDTESASNDSHAMKQQEEKEHGHKNTIHEDELVTDSGAKKRKRKGKLRRKFNHKINSKGSHDRIENTNSGSASDESENLNPNNKHDNKVKDDLGSKQSPGN